MIMAFRSQKMQKSISKYFISNFESQFGTKHSKLDFQFLDENRKWTFQNFCTVC